MVLITFGQGNLSIHELLESQTSGISVNSTIAPGNKEISPHWKTPCAKGIIVSLQINII